MDNEQKQLKKWNLKLLVQDVLVSLCSGCFCVFGTTGVALILTDSLPLDRLFLLGLPIGCIYLLTVALLCGIKRWKVDDIPESFIKVSDGLPVPGIVNNNTQDWQQYMCLVQIKKNGVQDIRPLRFSDKGKWIICGDDLSEYVIAWQPINNKDVVKVKPKGIKKLFRMVLLIIVGCGILSYLIHFYPMEIFVDKHVCTYTDSTKNTLMELNREELTGAQLQNCIKYVRDEDVIWEYKGNAHSWEDSDTISDFYDPANTAYVHVDKKYTIEVLEDEENKERFRVIIAEKIGS